MDWFQKIEFGIIMFLLVFNLFFLFNNKNVFLELFHPESMEIRNAPSDFISEDKIIPYSNRVVIEVENYSLSKYADTGSMIPVFDSNANGVGVKPNTSEELHVGDIITFHKRDNLIIHRIIEKGIDERGVYFITKGDNNDLPDDKVRFSQIESRLVAIIY